MSLKQRLASGKFIVAAELQPPKGTHLSGLFEQADRLRDRVDVIQIPDLQNAIMRLGSLSVCTLLKARGAETIFSLSCSDRNRLALQSDLLNASALGLENVLILQGDSPSMGDHYETKPVFDLDVLGLLGAVKRLREGYDLAGNELEGKPQFCVGAQVPLRAVGHEMDLEVAEMEKKVGLGVDFFITSSVYDAGLFETFIEKVAPLKVQILAAVTLLKSVGMARYINKHAEGALIPETVIDRLMKAPDKREASIEIAKEMILRLKPFCQGIQIIPVGWEQLIPTVLEQAGLWNPTAKTLGR
ncbi:MAG TPA: methylenetetrahydrofolate reductase [Thermodesulfobacteriota bacterium]|nr:methylenetetrahydrofolate reductase [Thermodesulfobacteriota bacterium]